MSALTDLLDTARHLTTVQAQAIITRYGYVNRIPGWDEARTAAQTAADTAGINLGAVWSDGWIAARVNAHPVSGHEWAVAWAAVATALHNHLSDHHYRTLIDPFTHITMPEAQAA